MQDILAEVIRVEKEIHGRLEAEREKTKQWVEQVRREMDEKLLLTEKGLKETLEQTIQKVREDAMREASKILNDANSEVEKIKNFSDKTLKTLLIKHISRVLPGFSHDSQDVKG